MAVEIHAPSLYLWQAAVLGAVQGLTEFLPISSTAHLALLPRFLHWPDPGLAFDVALHIGTLLAVMLYFGGDLWRMFASFLPARGAPDAARTRQRYLGTALVLGCLPAVIAGVGLEKLVATTLRAPVVMAVTLIGVALLMAWAELRDTGARRIEDLTIKDAVLIGVAQACALIPGVSRSGATITAGMFLDMERDAAARFSFLLGFPVIAGAALLEARHLPEVLALPNGVAMLAVGILVSFVSGYAAIAWLLRFLRTHSLWIFILYRLVLGVVILSWLPWWK